MCVPIDPELWTANTCSDNLANSPLCTLTCPYSYKGLNIVKIDNCSKSARFNCFWIDLSSGLMTRHGPTTQIKDVSDVRKYKMFVNSFL